MPARYLLQRPGEAAILGAVGRERPAVIQSFADKIQLVAAAWSGAQAAEGPVWPPVASAAPAEVAWQGAIEEFQPKGIGHIFRAVAGAERQQQTWLLPQPVAVAVVGERVFTVDTALGWVVGGKRDGGGAVRLKLPDGFSPVALASRGNDELLVADRNTPITQPLQNLHRCITDLGAMPFSHWFVPIF